MLDSIAPAVTLRRAHLWMPVQHASLNKPSFVQCTHSMPAGRQVPCFENAACMCNESLPASGSPVCTADCSQQRADLQCMVEELQACVIKPCL